MESTGQEVTVVMQSPNSGNNSDAVGLPNAALSADGPIRTQPNGKKPPRSRVACRFFGTAAGCRAGSQCPFAHSAPVTNVESSSSQAVVPSAPTNDQSKPARTSKRHYQARPVDQSKIVVKPSPVSHVSKRDHQIQQVKRRFNAVETSLNDSTIVSFKLQPTDPDFPYELEALDCVLQIPKTYPEDGPHLTVQNKEMEKGFRINVENGFDGIWRSSPGGNLLSWLNALDRQLEGLLSGKKASTIKIMPNRAKDIPNQSRQPGLPAVESTEMKHPQPAQVFQQPIYSQAQREAATSRRDADTRQLEARLGRQAMYAKSSDGIAYTLPIEPRKKMDLPAPLQNVKSMRLFVPMLYPLLPCRIALQGVPRESAQSVEQAFEQKVKQNPDTTLIGHINHLVTHMHLMASDPKEDVDFEADEIGIDELALSADEADHSVSAAQAQDSLDDRTHLHFIPRPPEWQTTQPNDEGHVSDDSPDVDDTSESEEEEKIQSSTTPERGVSIDFPNLELHGIELLDLIALSLSVRCSRCKEVAEIENLRHTDASTQSSRMLSCKKCASQISIAFHHRFLHTNSSRAGYLDLDNCTIADMLLSKFAPTCSNCSTTYTEPGVSAVRGDTTLAICRKCHTKMSFRIPEVKFLLVSSAIKALPLRKVKKPRENLGIRAGEPLPRHGRCKHYSKSKRWFRFGCCAKVYPCDRCHDETESHPNEHANRMICGYCSREQRYRPEDCGICKAILVGKKYTGFWEGGQGTRDKARMSRKDPRKYKRRGGTTVGSS